MGLGNLGCYIFSSASMQAPVDHCFTAGKRGDSFLGNATLLLSCPCPYLQRWPGYQWCLERNRWLSSGGVGCPSRTACSVVQTPCGSSGDIYSPVKIPQDEVQEYSHALTDVYHHQLCCSVLMGCLRSALLPNPLPFFFMGLPAHSSVTETV